MSQEIQKVKIECGICRSISFHEKVPENLLWNCPCIKKAPEGMIWRVHLQCNEGNFYDKHDALWSMHCPKCEQDRSVVIHSVVKTSTESHEVPKDIYSRARSPNDIPDFKTEPEKQTELLEKILLKLDKGEDNVQ